MESNCPFSGKPCDLLRCVKITDISKDKGVQEHHVCETCVGLKAEDKPATPEAALPDELKKSVIDLLSQVFASQASLPLFSLPATSPCPKCGMTLADFAAKGRIGCAECYEHFEKELAVLIVRCQGATKHNGKVPSQWKQMNDEQKKKAAEEATVEEKIKTLTLKMKKAVELENYEVAHVLKLKIQELKANPEATP